MQSFPPDHTIRADLHYGAFVHQKSVGIYTSATPGGDEYHSRPYSLIESLLTNSHLIHP